MVYVLSTDPLSLESLHGPQSVVRARAGRSVYLHVTDDAIWDHIPGAPSEARRLRLLSHVLIGRSNETRKGQNGWTRSKPQEILMPQSTHSEGAGHSPAGSQKRAEFSHEKLKRSTGQERKQIFLILTSSGGIRVDIDYRPSDHCDTTRILVGLGIHNEIPKFDGFN